MKTVIITQARYGSSRLPGKILMPVNDKSMLDLHLARLKLSEKSNEIWVATAFEEKSQEILTVAHRQGVHVNQGNLDDVLDRFYQTAMKAKADVVVRVTSDCPLNDGRLIDLLISKFFETNVDYLSNVMKPSFADGLDIEVFRFTALEEAWKEAKAKVEREHVTPYLYNEAHSYKRFNFDNTEDESHFRMTLDYQEDYDLLVHLVKNVGEMNPWQDYVRYLKSHPEVIVSRIRNETVKL